MANRVVIMSEGEIAQVGVPRDIYREPANQFVAEFVGRNNTINGKVSNIANGTLTVEAVDGKFTVTDNENTRSIQDETMFVIAADLVEISREPISAENTVSCTLISEEFIGSVVTLFLESEQGTEFKVQLQERELIQLEHNAGGKFYLRWKSSDSHLLPA